MSLKKVDPPFKYKTVEYDVMKVLKNFPYVVLTILSVYVCQKLGDFSISSHHCAEVKKGYHQLDMSSTKVTYENNLSDSIIDIITKFNLEKKCWLHL